MLGDALPLRIADPPIQTSSQDPVEPHLAHRGSMVKWMIRMHNKAGKNQQSQSQNTLHHGVLVGGKGCPSATPLGRNTRTSVWMFSGLQSRSFHECSVIFSIGGLPFPIHTHWPYILYSETGSRGRHVCRFCVPTMMVESCAVVPKPKYEAL